MAGALAACGGGGGSTTPVVVPTASPTPIAVASSVPATVTQQQTVTLAAASAGATPMPVPLPSVAGFATTVNVPLPTTATAVQLSATVSNVAPASLPPLSLQRFAQSVRHTTALPAGSSTLLFMQLYSSGALALPSAPGFTFVLPAADIFASADYYLALYDPTRPSLGWQYAFEGPAAPSGTSLTFAPPTGQFTFAGGVSYYFALFVIPQQATQPTPAPSVSPTAIATQPPPTSSQAAVQADAFVNSIGINTHWYYGSYASLSSQLLPLLTSSGILHIRDGMVVNPGAAFYSDFTTLASAGIHADLITSPGETPSFITAYPSNMPGAVEAIEGPNELDTSSDANYAADDVAFQQALYPAAHGAGYTVIGPSLISEQGFANVAQVASLANYADDGNIRAYFAGRNPGTTGWGAADSFGTYGALSYDIAIARLLTGTKPVVATESGYDDNLGATYGVPAAVKARYLLRTLLTAWNAGMPRTYLYELLDEGPTSTADFASSGIIDASGNPKPSYFAIKSLIGAVADPGASFNPTPLNYGLVAAPSVHSTLLQKRNGSYVLALWIEAPSWDPVAKSAITVAPQSVTLAFATAPSSVSAQTISDAGTLGTTAVTPNTSTSFSLQVTDNVTLVTIKP